MLGFVVGAFSLGYSSHDYFPPKPSIAQVPKAEKWLFA